MDQLDRHRKLIRLRIVGSAIIYVIFIAMAVQLGLRGTTFRDDMMLLWIIPFVLALVVLPRSTQPDRWPKAETAEEADRIEMMRAEMRATYQRTIVIRVVYLALAFLTVFMLGKMGV